MVVLLNIQYSVYQAEQLYSGCGVRDIDCMTEDGRSYEGKMMKTRAGVVCLAWDKLAWETPYSSYGSHNYCRNPGPPVQGGEDSVAPWCYTLQGWDYCNIRRCEDGCDDCELHLHLHFAIKLILQIR